MPIHMTVDIETYSSVDIKKAGLYKYVESPDFEVLLFAYSFDGAPVQVIDLASGEELPWNVRNALLSNGFTKHAYNAAFEWYCLSKYLGVTDKNAWLRQWSCSMIHALYTGFPASLAAAGQALGLPQDKQKDRAGKALIRLFCTPAKATKANGMRTRILPQHEPEKWELFKEYNKQDVVTEMEIDRRLSVYPLPASEQRLWELDMKINAFGVNIDKELMNGALSMAAETTDSLLEEARQISGISPKSVSQLKNWLESETDEEIENLNKESVKELLHKDVFPAEVHRMLQIRQEIGKTSCKKYDTMKTAICSDGRVRGLLQFYGANRTGRWAGRLVQVQNLPKNYLRPIDLARALVKHNKTAMLRFTFGSVPDTLSQLIRTTFIPSPGCKFLVADFSAIEARVISWLAKENWRQEVFATHGKIYEASASSMFGVPIDLIKKGNPEYTLRQKGKVAELALGYQGGTQALIKMGALKGGLTEKELPDIVRRWRAANPRIVDLWHKVENAAIDTIKTGRVNGVNGVLFSLTGDYTSGLSFLTITLPSGRQLFYCSPALRVNQFGKSTVTHMGLNQASKKWGVQETYGGKLVENIVQAIARDCLAVSMQRLHFNGYQIVMHIHDEVVIDCPEQYVDLDRACRIMGDPIDWAPGLLLRADGFITTYYKKD